MLTRSNLLAGALAALSATAVWAEGPAAAGEPAAGEVEVVVVTARYDGQTLGESLLAAARPSFEPPVIRIAKADLEPPRLSRAPAEAPVVSRQPE